MQTPRDATAAALERLWRLALGIAVVLALFFAREVLVPGAVAMLLSFVLTPVVRRLERWLGKIVAVLLVVSLAFAAAGSVGWVLTRQLVDVGTKIPDYRENILAKARGFKPPGGPAFSRLEQMLNELRKELPGPPQPSAPKNGGTNGSKAPGATPTPIPVHVVPATAPGSAELARKTAVFLLGPLGQVALVLLLLIFILIEREDIRARLLRLAGAGRMGPTTLAMDDAARRLGHYLGFQLLVNIAYGTCVATGLYFIGIPNAILWGGLAGTLRFLPYVGPWLGATPPILLSLAIFPGWVALLLTLGLFAALELINANAIEPWLYGSATGVTPLAIVAGAIFWTWIWGPVGLLLAVPLTLCLAVLGRHVPGLAFLGVLLSDQPALTPREQCYNRLLAFDPDEASSVAASYLEDHPLAALYDEVLIPVLTMAELDSQRGALNEEQHKGVLQGVRDVVEDLRDWPRKKTEETKEPEKRPLALTRKPVYCLRAKTEHDELAGMMLSQLLNEEAFGAVAVHGEIAGEALFSLLAENHAEAVWISAVPPSSVIHTRRLVSALRDRFPGLWIGVGLWGAAKKPQRLQDEGAAALALSVAEAVELSRPLIPKDL